MPRKPKLTLADVEAMKNAGYSQSEISRMVGQSRQAISWIKQTYGGSLTPREQILKEHFPWKVPAKLSQASPYYRLREHAEFFATGGKGMSPAKIKRVQGLYRRLRESNTVIEFDPDLPPESGVSSVGGWAYRDRVPSDGELMIRVNEYTNLTKEGEIIWELPKEEP